MPIVKTEVSTRTRANIAYVAAMLEVSESQVYGLVLDHLAGEVSPEKLEDIVRRMIDKGVAQSGTDS